MDSYEERLQNTLFNSLWVKAVGDCYPQELQPYSSCTKELLESLADTIRDIKPKRVLDLGCGSGGLSIWLAKVCGCTVVGLDRSFAAIEFARERAEKQGLCEKVSFEVASFEDIKKLAGSFDMVVSIDALPFAKDECSVLTDLHQCLNKGGQLVFTTRAPLDDSPKFNRLGKAWSKALTASGFGNPVEVMERTGVSEYWASIYHEWIVNESRLRKELSGPVVDLLINEANEVGSRLFDGRSWWLIKAQKA
jgi:2-polyprenyl-3-methyl-5-hydroxy-6-metoxy-1,4-benzoquinol methylase